MKLKRRWLSTHQLAKITNIGIQMLGKQDEMLGKQDEMLGKQDEMLGKQDEMLGKQDEIKKRIKIISWRIETTIQKSKVNKWHFSN